jgi:short chain dehydrogenase
MVRSIVITGASKDIGRAATDALVEGGWSVIGVVRSSPANFPGVFIEADLADRKRTQDLADDLVARGNVLGIVNNVGLARHERVDAVDPDVFAMVMDSIVRPALQLTQALLPGMRAARFGRIILHHQPCDARTRVSFKLRRGKGSAGKHHAHHGNRARGRRHHRECRRARPYRNRAVSLEQSARQRRRGQVFEQSADAAIRAPE